MFSKKARKQVDPRARIKEIFRSVVNDSITPRVTAMGFKRCEADRWYRRSGDSVASTGCHLRTVRGYDYAWLGVGVSVGYLSLTELLRKASH